MISMGIVMIGLMRATLSGRDLMQKYDVLWIMMYQNMIMNTVSYIIFTMDIPKRLYVLPRKITRLISWSGNGLLMILSIYRKEIVRG